MTKFIIAPEKCNWYTTEAKNSAGAYCKECNWFSSHVKIAVINTETSEVSVYTRELDKDGNLITINTEDLRIF